MLKNLSLVFVFLVFLITGFTAIGQTPTITVDLSGSADTSVTITDISRDGSVCSSPSGERCIVFNIILNAGSDILNFDVKNPGPPGGAFYRIDCSAPTSLNTPVCISGKTTVSISFCKSGNDQPNYIITASRTVRASDDITLRQGCSGIMSVMGLQTSSIVWTSIFPGAQGAYNSYLSPASGSATTTVTPASGAPAYIDYLVSGNQTTTCIGPRTDTVRVFTTPPLTVATSPSNPMICSGASITLTATPSGGSPAYTYTWNTGATTPSITVSTPGTYTVSVMDQLSGCPPTVQQVVVGASPTPAAPTATGTTICSGSTATLTATGPGGTYSWYTASTGGTLLGTGASFTTPTLTDNATYYVETLLGCVSSRTPVTVSVTPLPLAPTASGTTVCSGSTATLSATGPGGTYEWYSALSGGTLLASGASYTTPTLTSNTTYYVQTIVDGCPGPRTAVNVTVTPLPAAPTVSNTTICTGNTATLTASAPGGNYQWYDAETGGNLLATSPTYTTSALTSAATYYVQTTVNGCIGPRTAVTVSVNPPPAAPTASGTTICSGNTATLIATAPGGTYTWYTASSGGTAVGSGPSFTTPVLTSTTTYYVETLLGCVSSRTPVTVSVTPLPAAPTVSGTTICAGSTATLAASAPGGTYQWYNSASGGTLLGTGVSFTTPALTNTTTYYVQTTVNGCPGPRSAATVTVTPLPAAPTAAGATICAGNTATLMATAPGGSYQWYSAATGGALLGTTATYTTPALNVTTTYYVQTTVNGCTSARTSVEVTVVPQINPEFRYSSGTYCKAGDPTTPAPQIFNGPGNFSGSIGLSIDAISGVINVAATAPGPYIVSYTSTSQCPRTTTATVTISTNPDASFSYSGPFCTGATNPLPNFGATGSAGVFSSSAGLNFVNSSTGEINLATSTPGTYTVTNTISGGSCADVETSLITITSTPLPPTASGATICAGSNTTLTATATDGSYGWFNSASGGTLLSSSQTFQTPNLINTTTFYVETTVGVCTSPRTAVTVTVNPKPASPSVSGITICAGNTATLVATAPGGIYNWYSNAAGGTSLGTGVAYTTDVLTNTTTFYVETKISGCTSTRTAVQVTVTPLPAAPTVSGASVCVGNSATLKASGSGGTYDWYDAAVGGNLVMTGETFTTPILNSNINYYVQSTAGGCAGARTLAAVTVTPKPAAPTVTVTAICAGTVATLTATVSGGIYEWYDVASGGTVISTGASFNTPTLTTNTTYYVQSVINGCSGPRATVTVTVIPLPAAPTVLGTTICFGTSASLTATGPGGTYQWFDAATGGTLLITDANFKTPVLTSNTTYYVQTTINGCPGPRTAVTVSITPLPAAPIAPGATICSGNSAILTATAPGGVYQWFDAASGGNLIATGASYNTPVLNANSTYYVQAFVNGCAGPRTAVSVIVTSIPPAPTAAGVTICSGTPAILNATAPGGNYRWYDASVGGNLLETGNSLNTGLLTATRTFFVETTINGCISPRTPVIVAITPIPAAPSVTAPAICVGNNTTLTANGPGGIYQWYDAASGGNLLQTGNSYTTPVLNVNTTFYVQTIINGCISPRAAVQVTTIPIINPEFEYSSGTYCKSGSAISPAPVQYTIGGGTFSSTPGLVFADINTGAINVAATPLGTYTITFTNNSQCPRASTVNITITNAPDATFSYNSSSFCTGSINAPAIFAPGASAGIFSAMPGGLVFLSTNTGEINLSASLPGIYQVTNNIAANGGCAAATYTRSVTINSSPVSPTVVSGITICANNSTVLTASAPGGIYEWFSAAVGGTRIATGALFTTPVLKTTTTYYVQSTTNGCTGPRSAVTVQVIPVIDPEFEYSSGTYCKSGMSITPPPGIYTLGGGTFSSSSGLVFRNKNTGEIDVLASTVGTYTVSFTNNSPCPRITSAKVTITNFPNATFSYSGPYCPGSTNPIPDFPAGASAGIFSSSSPALVFVSTTTGEIDLQLSSPGIYIITNTIVANGGCVLTTFTSTVTINSIPGTPNAKDISICKGSTALLSVSELTGNYQWFEQAVGGTMIGIGDFFTTPALTSTTSYYVQAISNNCVSSRKKIVVTVNPIPVAPVVVSNSPVCTGNTIALGATFVPGAIYTWEGPNNFSSNLQNPSINLANASNAGMYKVFINVNGCISPVSQTEVKINEAPLTVAGPDQTLCVSTDAINLKGSVQGVSSTGIWSSNGTGTFSPSNTSLNAIYIPSAADKAALKFTLTLTSTNNVSCAPATSSLAVTLIPLPVVNAGPDQIVCADGSQINLTGFVYGASGGVWNSAGDGHFSSSSSSLKATYIPGPQDMKTGWAMLTLSSTGNGLCSTVTDEVLITMNPLPKVFAGKDKVIRLNETVTLNDIDSDPQVQYLWSPATGLDDYTSKNPVFSGNTSQTYSLTVTNDWGCSSTDEVFVKVLEPIIIPNTFTPNGDGSNDLWNIAQLKNYTEATVLVYNRYGEKLFYSQGYDSPWDGNYNGVEVPAGTYYYVIDTKMGDKYSGWILIVK